MKFKNSVCEAVLPGIVELMAISMLIGFFNLLNSIFGVCFVIRNKIDVPQSLSANGSGRKSSQRSNSYSSLKSSPSNKNRKNRGYSSGSNASVGNSWSKDDTTSYDELQSSGIGAGMDVVDNSVSLISSNNHNVSTSRDISGTTTGNNKSFDPNINS
jgi:hypothetical protein